MQPTSLKRFLEARGWFNPVDRRWYIVVEDPVKHAKNMADLAVKLARPAEDCDGLYGDIRAENVERTRRKLAGARDAANIALGYGLDLRRADAHSSA